MGFFDNLNQRIISLVLCCVSCGDISTWTSDCNPRNEKKNLGLQNKMDLSGWGCHIQKTRIFRIIEWSLANMGFVANGNERKRERKRKRISTLDMCAGCSFKHNNPKLWSWRRYYQRSMTSFGTLSIYQLRKGRSEVRITKPSRLWWHGRTSIPRKIPQQQYNESYAHLHSMESSFPTKRNNQAYDALFQTKRKTKSGKRQKIHSRLVDETMKCYYAHMCTHTLRTEHKNNEQSEEWDDYYNTIISPNCIHNPSWAEVQKHAHHEAIYDPSSQEKVGNNDGVRIK